MHIDTASHAIDAPEIIAPLSLRLAEARLQLGAMLTAGEIGPGPVRNSLRGLECFLLDASVDALGLESDAALALARRRRLPRWFGFVGRRP